MSTDIHGISITITSGRYIGRHKPDGIVWGTNRVVYNKQSQVGGMRSSETI